MTAVKEYGRTLTKGLGAHAGDIEAREPGCGIMLVMLQAGRRACSVVAAQICSRRSVAVEGRSVSGQRMLR